ncbi:hypothetical protein [Paenibacillus medicaginis]|uniref:Uncharacterized protein n=1 Tax=Paenibacillus medicaginis TaxID=1470560 RepID=A0ABV5BUR4_9BACL
MYWRDVFDSRKIFPADFYECRKVATSVGYKYFAFNGVVFGIGQQAPNYDDGLCKIEDLR